MLDYETVAIAGREWEHPFSAVVALSTPAAGGGFTFTNPGSVVSEIQSVTCELVTSSAAASRIPVLTVKGPGGATLGVFPSPFTFAASKTTQVTWGVGLVSTGANDGARVTVPIPSYVIESGYQLVVSVDAEDTGDQLSNVVLAARQWPVRPPIGN